MGDGSRGSHDAPPQRSLFPGAQSRYEIATETDVDAKGNKLLAKERALPELRKDLYQLTHGYYEEFVKVADELPEHQRRVWPGQKPGHFYNKWDDEVVLKPDSSLQRFIFKSRLFFDKESALLEKPDLKSYEADIWKMLRKDERNPDAKVNIEFSQEGIKSISFTGLMQNFARIAGQHADSNDDSEWGYNLFFGQFLMKDFRWQRPQEELRIILSPQPTLLLYNQGSSNDKHFSFYKFDDESEEPLFRGNLSTDRIRTGVSGATSQSTLTPRQFKQVVEGALLVLPRKAA